MSVATATRSSTRSTRSASALLPCPSTPPPAGLWPPSISVAARRAFRFTKCRPASCPTSATLPPNWESSSAKSEKSPSDLVAAVLALAFLCGDRPRLGSSAGAERGIETLLQAVRLDSLCQRSRATHRWATSHQRHIQQSRHPETHEPRIVV